MKIIPKFYKQNAGRMRRQTRVTSIIFDRVFFLLIVISYIFSPPAIQAESKNGKTHARYRSPHYAGRPVATEQYKGKVVVYNNKGYSNGYDENRKGPVWTAYRLFKVGRVPKTHRRTRFNTDMRTIAKISEKDYTHSGYSRGHMAPSYAMAVCHGKKAQKKAFLMSNMLPQIPEFNSGPWAELEIEIIQKYAPRFEKIWIITGPVFDSQIKRLPKGPEIPDAFYKIIIDESGSKVRTLAFLMPHEARSVHLNRYLTSIDRIEKLTGLDFLVGLPDRVEAKLEAMIPTARW